MKKKILLIPLALLLIASLVAACAAPAPAPAPGEQEEEEEPAPAPGEQEEEEEPAPAPPVVGLPSGVVFGVEVPDVAREFLEEEVPYVYLGPDMVTPEEVITFMNVVGSPAIPLAITPRKRYRIAMIFPSLDLSDAWYCGWTALEGRMEELGIPYELTTMGGAIDDHVLQAAHIETAIAQKFDYVIIAPGELMMQAAGIRRMIDAGINVIVWNFTDPLKDWGLERYPEGQQPLAYMAFSDIVGGTMMGEYALTRLEPGSKIALMHGIPGILTQSRIGIGAAMFEAAGHEIVYVHYADYQKDKAYEATKAIIAAYPDVDLIYNTSTAMAYGIAAALKELGLTGQILVNGYGGGWGEQKLLWEGALDWAVMRMQDDWGVALAEIIKYDIEGRRDEIPLVVIGGVVLITDEMTPDDVVELTAYAYRYSGVVEY